MIVKLISYIVILAHKIERKSLAGLRVCMFLYARVFYCACVFFGSPKPPAFSSPVNGFLGDRDTTLFVEILSVFKVIH